MIEILLPEQYLQRAGARAVEPRERLMLAVLRRAVNDCLGSADQRAAASGPGGDRVGRDALAYVSSTDRTWAFSFENLCDAIGLDAGSLRRGLRQAARHAAAVARC
jgi:hypothetical protein